MIKVTGFCKRHPNLTHLEYAAAHAGFHVSLGRRMRNLVGYLHYSWTDAKFEASVPGASRGEPEDFYDLWDGFSELYFASADDYFRAFEPVRDRAGEHGLVDDSVRADMERDTLCLYDVVHQFATVEHVIVPVVHPERRPVIVQQWAKCTADMVRDDLIERWRDEYGPLYRELPGVLGYSVTTRMDRDVVRGFIGDRVARIASTDPAVEAHEHFYGEWTSYAMIFLESLDGLRAFRASMGRRLERLEDELFEAVWYREVVETVGKIPYRDSLSTTI
jgi:hypothetical protein